MKIIITDTGKSPVKITSDDIVIRKIDKILSCNGCFDCYTKTPGICSKKDDLKHLGEAMSKAKELILVSHMTYGSYSAYVKTVLERTLPYLCPTYMNQDGEMKHKKRYENTMKLSAYFYGEEITEEEKQTARDLLEANAKSLGAKVMNVIFLKDASEVGGGVQ